MIRIAAGIVTYNPEPCRLKENIDAVLSQVECIYIVDNNSKNFDEWKKIVDRYEIKLIKFKANKGIAKALNTIMDMAKNDGYEWVLTLDDDSVIAGNYMKEIEPYLSENIGIVCGKPIYQGQNNSLAHKDSVDTIVACMTSGSVTNVKAWYEIKGYDEWMFIDFVDNDFCKRLELNGYKILRVNYTEFNHQLGKTKTISVFGRYIILRNYSSLRNYYSVRNQIYFIRKYLKSINVMWYVSRLIYVEGQKLMFEGNKKETFFSIVHGVVDGFNKKI